VKATQANEGERKRESETEEEERERERRGRRIILGSTDKKEPGM